MPLKIKKLKWCNPLIFANKIACNYNEKNWIFLYSALNKKIKNSKSIIALFSKNELNLDNLDQLKKYLKKAQSYENSYFGYVSYEYKNDLEKFEETQKSYVNLPKILLMNFSLIFEFDHDKKLLKSYFEDEDQLKKVLKYKSKKDDKKKIKISNFQSNFSSEKYLQTIDEIKEMISRGDFYQTNLTRKFFGKINLNKQKDFFEIFKNLTESGTANYSSFLKFGDNFIISASPELFLNVKNKIALSRPIKGTAPRFNSKKLDEESKNYLQNSQKEKAENLMIVDLVRNDLSRICKAKSVKVKNLFKIDSYKNLHHLSSEVIGKIDDQFDVVDAFKSCFPAGSMTGAPKIKAIEIAMQKEKINRGVYSGAIGYFKDLNTANFSVVIRTLICKKNQKDSDFEFQVGGAITYDSSAQKELEETFIKAKTLYKILNIKNKL